VASSATGGAFTWVNLWIESGRTRTVPEHVCPQLTALRLARALLLAVMTGASSNAFGEVCPV
jgi:hypothetical protein